ncbi:MAG: hypothetical protein ACD_28C00108G0024 [uncultured bacterium]|nr:MAG: hypothetical protein ACD_28C00108G0024 [uncultured bacterium]KKT75383.1 MAG: Anthranilate synthase [Candidatus Peregrinibacteria bacterium GW2011_GWA2_44_7]
MEPSPGFFFQFQHGYPTARPYFLWGFGLKREWKAYTFHEAFEALESIQAFLNQHRGGASAGGFESSVFGYLSYELGRALEGLPFRCESSSTPLLHFVLPEKVMVRDCLSPEFFSDIQTDFSSTVPVPQMSFSDYAAGIDRIHDYLRKGETYELNFAYRFDAQFKGDPWGFFQGLMQMNPSPYACYLDFDPITVVSCSPELLVRGAWNGNHEMVVETRPIKGTVPRGQNFKEDEKLKKELLANPKIEAELNMIVDLARNDLGRVCRVGSVQVPEHRVVESYSHVHHTMSHVTGILEKGLGWREVLESVFPGGSVTGAPKKRTMELIQQLEPVPRGVYTGSAGWISPNGEFCFNILIRTMALDRRSGQLSFHSGGAVVMDSTAQEEYEETLHKAAVLQNAILNFIKAKK